MGASTITSRQLPTGRSWDYGLVMALALVIALANMMYTCYSVGQVEGIKESGAFLTEFPYTLNGLHILISFGLVLCTIGLWLRRISGLIISSAALLFVAGVCGFWRFQTVRYLSEFKGDWRAYDRLRSEVGLFHGATKLDFLVLSLVGVLLMWHLIMLIKMTRKEE